MNYRYRATIKEIHDGDTITCDINLGSLPDLRTLPLDASRIDLGFCIDIPIHWATQLVSEEEQLWLRNQRIRLYGVNAPELTTSAGILSRGYVRSHISIGTHFEVETFRVKSRTKQEKYGRYLGIIFLLDGTNLNEQLVSLGYAVRFMI